MDDLRRQATLRGGLQMLASKFPPYHVGLATTKGFTKEIQGTGGAIRGRRGRMQAFWAVHRGVKPTGLPTSTEKRPVKALKSKPKPMTSISRSSKHGKEVPPSDDEQRWNDDEATGKASSKSTSKENVKNKDPDGERATKMPRLAAWTIGTAGERLKRQALSASIKPSKKSPNVDASGSGWQTPAEPLPTGEKETSSVVSAPIGRPDLAHRVCGFEPVNDPLTESGSFAARDSCGYFRSWT